MKNSELKELLDELHDKYNRIDFIADDPISIPHLFDNQQDIEIAGLLASTIAWGNRKAIVKSAHRMIKLLDERPYDFTMSASDAELTDTERFVHRTFNGHDFRAFILALRRMYRTYGSLGTYFETEYGSSGDLRVVLAHFRRDFFAIPHSAHCEKHISSIERKAACKRLNMYLRWMVRSDNRGVDFGLWSAIPMSALYLPLDVHSGNMARELGILERRTDDWRAVEEVTAALRQFDPEDPIKYDFALFGAGIDGYLKGNGQ